MMHIDERQIALMASDVVGSDVLIDCYFTNDSKRLTECLESKLGKDVASSFLGKTAINSRARILPDIQKTVMEAFPLQTNKFDLNIDYGKKVIDTPIREQELERGRVR